MAGLLGFYCILALSGCQLFEEPEAEAVPVTLSIPVAQVPAQVARIRLELVRNEGSIQIDTALTRQDTAWICSLGMQPGAWTYIARTFSPEEVNTWTAQEALAVATVGGLRGSMIAGTTTFSLKPEWQDQRIHPRVTFARLTNESGFALPGDTVTIASFTVGTDFADASFEKFSIQMPEQPVSSFFNPSGLQAWKMDLAGKLPLARIGGSVPINSNPVFPGFAVKNGQPLLVLIKGVIDQNAPHGVSIGPPLINSTMFHLSYGHIKPFQFSSGPIIQIGPPIYFARYVSRQTFDGITYDESRSDRLSWNIINARALPTYQSFNPGGTAFAPAKKQYLNLQNKGVFQHTGPVTIACSVYVAANPNGAIPLFHSAYAPGIQGGLSLYLTTNLQPVLTIGDGSSLGSPSRSFEAGAYIKPNEWAHLTAVYHSTTLASFYLNGRDIGSITTGALVSQRIPGGTEPVIGLMQNASAVSAPYFFGDLIDNFTYFNRALSASEVQQLADGNVQALNPTLYLPFNHSIADQSGNNHQVVPLGLQPTWSDGFKSGKKALDLDGFMEYAEFKTDPLYKSAGPFTWLLRFKTPDPKGGLFQSSFNRSFHEGLALYLSDEGFPCLLLGNGELAGSVSTPNYTGTRAVPANTWVTLMLVVSPGNPPALYMNGDPVLLVENRPGTAVNMPSGRVLLGVMPTQGHNTPPKTIRAVFDELRIYDRTFTAGEAASFYNSYKR